MTLVRMLHFCAAHYNMHVMITHIIGTDNCIADVIFISKWIAGSIRQSPCRRHPRFGDPFLSQLQECCQYLGIAPFTRRVYRSGIKAFYNFCDKF